MSEIEKLELYIRLLKSEIRSLCNLDSGRNPNDVLERVDKTLNEEFLSDETIEI